MNPDDVHNFLSRWSRRKLEKTAPAPKPVAVPETATVLPAQETAEPAPPPEPLPPVESLTPESDFKPFMRPDVEPGLKQAALRQLFKDPHFNVMDGLDTYIDDYSIADPIPDAMMKNLYQAREHLFSPEEKAAANAADAAEASAKAVQSAPTADPVFEPPAEAPVEQSAAPIAKDT